MSPLQVHPAMTLARLIRAVGPFSVVGAVLVLSSCGGGSGPRGTPTPLRPTPEPPGADVRVVEGESGWQVGIPVAVKQGTELIIWLNPATLETGNSVTVNVYLDRTPGGAAGFFRYSVASPGWGQLRFSSFAGVSVPGKYVARVTDQSQNTLVQTDFVVTP
jgi:hypothetical protein